jgi:hypothetical protein
VKRLILAAVLLVAVSVTVLSGCQVYYSGKFEYEYDIDTKAGYQIILSTNLTYTYVGNGVTHSGRYSATVGKVVLNLDVDGVETIAVKMISRYKISITDENGETIQLTRQQRNILDPV